MKKINRHISFRLSEQHSFKAEDSAMTWMRTPNIHNHEQYHMKKDMNEKLECGVATMDEVNYFLEGILFKLWESQYVFGIFSCSSFYEHYLEILDKAWLEIQYFSLPGVR